jgi:hypothetical protein
MYCVKFLDVFCDLNKAMPSLQELQVAFLVFTTLDYQALVVSPCLDTESGRPNWYSAY